MKCSYVLVYILRENTHNKWGNILARLQVMPYLHWRRRTPVWTRIWILNSIVRLYCAEHIHNAQTPYSLFLCRTGIWVGVRTRVRLRKCEWAIMKTPKSALLTQWRIYIVKFWTPPRGPNSFNFMQFFVKFWRNRMLPPPPGVGTPSSGKS